MMGQPSRCAMSPTPTCSHGNPHIIGTAVVFLSRRVRSNNVTASGSQAPFVGGAQSLDRASLQPLADPDVPDADEDAELVELAAYS
jgi:hypothetical protein